MSDRKEKIDNIKFILEDNLSQYLVEGSETEDLEYVAEEVYENIGNDRENLKSILKDNLVENEYISSPSFLLVNDDLLDLFKKVNEGSFRILGEEEEVEGEDGDIGTKGVGECPLCQREMFLTKHHLIPRETHDKLKKKGMTKKQLNYGVFVCRECHSHIHGMMSNDEMAEKYSTMEKLLENEKVKKWLPWIRKQKQPKLPFIYQRKYKR